MKKLFFVPLIAMTLTACQGIPVPGQGTQPTPNYRAPGTAVIAHLDTEAELLSLINEVRTQGTLRGDAGVRANTCAANWTPLQPLAFHGALHFAARKYADYLAHEIVRTGEMTGTPHVQSNTDNPYFYGRSITDRAARAATEHNFAPIAWASENAAFNSTAHAVVLAWLRSPGHCVGLVDPNFSHAAVGMGSTGGVRAGPYHVAHTWVMKFTGPIR